jgi:hypothetical protein
MMYAPRWIDELLPWLVPALAVLGLLDWYVARMLRRPSVEEGG